MIITTKIKMILIIIIIIIIIVIFVVMWRSRQKKKERRRRPQIEFESAESEIDGFSDACVPPSGAQAKSQEASTPMLDFDHMTFLKSDCISARSWSRTSPCPCARPIVLVLWVLTATTVLVH